MTLLVLASASPSRRTVLKQAGITPLVRVSDVDEEALVAREGLTAATDVAQALAQAKAQSVAAVGDLHVTDADVAADAGVFERDGERRLLIGCDSVLELDGEVFGKPGTPERARLLWSRMAGREAALHSGHWLIDLDSGQEAGATSTALIRTADIRGDELEAYLATGEPLAVAGALTIDGFGGPFVTGITGDHHGVLGLSLPLMRELAAQLGHFWPDLWDHRR